MNDTTTDLPVATGGKDKGFTLIELLIVIVILGVLATVTVFAVRGITDKGEDSACKAEKNTLETAIESYFAQEGVTAFPDAVADNPATPEDDSVTPMKTLVADGFLRSASVKYSINVDGSLAEVGSPAECEV